MKFNFLPNEPLLMRAVNFGGCGLTAAQIAAVTVWQRQTSYKFSDHIGRHGHYAYIFIDGARDGERNMPRIFLSGANQYSFENAGTLSSRVKTDVEAVVRGNLSIFQAIFPT